MSKGFNKGDEVTFFNDWDRKGTVYYRHCVVYSCGHKQMVLTDAITGEEVGRHYNPGKSTGLEFGTRERMFDEAADALCLEMGAATVIRERERMETAIARYGHPETDGYNISMRKSIAALHEPRALNRTGSPRGI